MATAEFTQQGRRIQIETPLGKDKLLLTHFDGKEELSRLFTYRLEMLSEDDGLKPKDIVGKNVTFSVQYPDKEYRYFNGIVRRFAYCGTGDRLTLYRAEVVPWLWFLTQTADCRIFQEKKVPDIIKQIFSDLGHSDFEMDAKGNHPTWDYCVQYRETDFNFVSRLMEKEGLFYFFKHEKGKHTLVISDSNSAFKDCKESEAEFTGNLASLETTYSVSRWEHQYEFRTGKWAQTDYNFETPSTSLMSQTNSLVKFDGNTKYEIYDYPGEYTQRGDGDGETKIRMESDEVDCEVVIGESTCRSFTPGGKFKLKEHTSRSEKGKKYIFTSVHHQVTMGGSYTTSELADVKFSYNNVFTCIPDSVNFRPAPITPKPMVHGSQTALVVGPPGEEIWPDQYGRVKVQFYWDREGKKDDKSSCWIRVSQGVAGKGWGMMHIPRIGQEVIVSYLEGDPDRPLITGVVFNAGQMPPYDLPGEKTKTYIKSNSSPGGSGFNEIRFEDKAGQEQFFMHAERNLEVRIKKDRMDRVIGNHHEIIGENHAGDHLQIIHGNKEVNIKGNLVTLIEGDIKVAFNGNLETSIKGDKKEKIEGDQHLTINGDSKNKVGGSYSSQIDGDNQLKIQRKHAIDAGQEVHIKGGMTVVIEAGMQLTIKAGPSFITLGPDGVSIQGPLVRINSGGAAGSGSGCIVFPPSKPGKANPKVPTEADDTATSGSKSAP